MSSLYFGTSPKETELVTFFYNSTFTHPLDIHPQ